MEEVAGHAARETAGGPGLPRRGTPARWERIRCWLGLEQNIPVMLAILLIVGMGEELWVRFLPQYLQSLGAGVWVVASYGALYSLLDAVYQYPGGWLADRLGRRAALIGFTLLAALGYGLYLVGPGWEWVLAGTFLVMAWDSLTLPALFAIVGDSLPPQRRAMGFGVQSVLRRLPTVVAPPVGGILIAAVGLAAGVRLGLAVTIALALLAAFLVWRFYVPQPMETLESAGFRVVWRGLDRRLKRLLVADVLARWAEGIPKVFVVIYVMDVLGRSAVEAGWLMTIQRVTNVLVYLPLAPLSDRMSRRPFVLLTFAFFALFPLALVNASGFLGLAAAFVVAGLWEVGEPARKALIVDRASKKLRGRTIGLYYLLRNLSVFPAALIGGLIWSTLGPRPVFYVAFGTGVLGFLAYAFWDAADDRDEIASTNGRLERGDAT